eukprot:TRINITY_DN1503_c2_g2_i1.p1 TRINITY_DN1503_c2_g2~~TRINITY_DN1503_c2_g2_i1.p1  ORF type:complete len:755 (+),score=161.47 TRINITY_DN1503_c2_g2_i1:36-2267(+)
MALASCEYMIVFTEVLGKDALEAVIAHTVGKLEGAGLVVERIEGHEVLLVQAPLRLLEKEAQKLGYLKEIRGGQGDVLEFVLTEKTPEIFENYHTQGFWTKSEEAELFLSYLENVEGVQGLEEPLRTLSKIARNSALKVPSSLIAALRIAGLIETFAPLHEPRTKHGLWEKTRAQLFSPEDDLCEYFGPSVAMYFTWLNMFTAWLMVPGFIGLCFFLHMQVSSRTVDDHPYLPFYGLFVVFWAVCFLSFWKRRAARKSWGWRVYKSKQDLNMPDMVRPEFRGELRECRVTGRQQRFYPRWKRMVAYGVSVVVTGFMLGVAFFVMILSLNLQGYIDGKIVWEEPLHFPTLGRYAIPGALFDPNQLEYFGALAFMPTIIHVVIIMHLNMFYRKVAEWLTNNENHRFEEDHANSLILKRFLFESFDCYISLFYLGFVQQDIKRLRLELISLYTVDSIRRVTLETVIPFLLGWFATKKLEKKNAKDVGKERKGSVLSALSESRMPEYECFDDYLEMVIEFGYVVLFASAFPLAAALSVVCNVIEMKSDLLKLTMVYQRPAPARVSNIGIWQNLLWALMWLAIFTNTMLLVSSDQLTAHFPSFYREAIESDVLAGRVAALATDPTHHELVIKRGAARWVLIIAFVCERVAFLLALLLTKLIPSVPEDVATEIRRHEYQKSQALKEKMSAASTPLHDRSRPRLSTSDFNGVSLNSVNSRSPTMLSYRSELSSTYVYANTDTVTTSVDAE